MATYDTWGGHWGTSWALSWTREVPVPGDVTATPGFIRSVYEYYKRGRGRDDEEDRPVRDVRDGPRTTEEAVKEYAERSEILAAAIAKLRAESAQLRQESAQLRERMEAASSRKALARLDAELFLKDQAVVLAQAEEQALLEEIELNDVMGVALIALAYVMQ